jgi:hypothetical protein
MIPVPGKDQNDHSSGEEEEEEDQKSSNSYSRTTAIPPEGADTLLKQTLQI